MEDGRVAKEKGDQLFLLLDTDKDGAISQKEMEEARSLLAGCQVEDYGMELVEFQSVDHDGSGSVDKIEWNEFIASLVGLVGHRKFLACADAWIEFLSDATDKLSELPANDQTPAQSKRRPSRVKAASSKRRPSRVKTADTASTSTDDTTQAALKIQSTFRGNKSRKSVAVKSRPSTFAASSRAPGTVPCVKRLERKLTTVDGVWNMLCDRYAESSRKIELTDLVKCLEEMQETGLDMELASLVPMANEDDVAPEILSPEELRHLGRFLCGLKSEDVASFSEERARAELDAFFCPLDLKIASEDQIRDADKREAQLQEVGENPRLTLSKFRRLLCLQADLMNIELQYVVSHLAWLLTGDFEMPEPLARRLIEQCMPGARSTSDSLDTVFGMSSLAVMAYNGGLVDTACQAGLPSNEISGIYHQVCVQVASAHETDPGSVTLSGRTEFELVLQGIQKAMPRSAGFRSPLQMAVSMLSKAGEGRALDRPTEKP